MGLRVVAQVVTLALCGRASGAPRACRRRVPPAMRRCAPGAARAPTCRSALLRAASPAACSNLNANQLTGPVVPEAWSEGPAFLALSEMQLAYNNFRSA